MMPAAASSSFPSRGRAAPFGSRAVPPPSPRLSAALGRPRVSGLGGGSEGEAGKILDPRATPVQILGLDGTAGYSAAQLKAAFRARVKEFHPDVCKDPENADLIIRRVIEAYQDAHILVLKGHLMCFHFQMMLALLEQYLKVMVKMTLFSSLLGNVQESVYTMLLLANALFWRMFLLVC